MPSFVVERYRASSDPDSLSAVADRLTAGARQVSVDGGSVRYEDTIFLPGDETCMHLFEAASEADVRAWTGTGMPLCEADAEAAVGAVAGQAGIDIDRIVPAEQIEPSRAGWRF